MEIKEFTTVNVTTNRLYLLEDRGKRFILKCYKEPGGAIRCEREKQMLNLWKSSGFHVPRTFELDLDAKWSPCLAMEFLPGISLKEHLRSPDISVENKLMTIEKLFLDNCSRHKYVRDARQPLFIHDDPNPGNILLYDGKFYYLDFEQHGGHKHRQKKAERKSILDQTAVEATRLIRWLAQDIGATYLPDIVNRMLYSYASYPEVPRYVISSIEGRSFQTLHRWKDRRKKKRKPGYVTKYDIVDALVSSLKKPI